MKTAKHKALLISGLFLSILFLFLAFRNINFSEVIIILAETNYWFILPLFSLLLFDFTIRAFRWNMLLNPIKKCSFPNVISTLFIGFFANIALPLRAGEVIRIIMIGEKENISKSTAAATMVVERTMDLFAVFVLFSISLLFFITGDVPDTINKLWKLTGLVLGVIVVILYGLMYSRKFTVNTLKKIFNKLPEKISERGCRILNSFILGLDILKTKRHLSLALFYSLVSWTANSLVFFFVARGMGIIQLRPLLSPFVMGVVSTGISIPAAPGFIGTYHYFTSVALRILGVSESAAISFAVLDHALRMSGIAVGGIFFLMREHISVAQLGAKAQKNQSEQ